jgi:hypothetical protein
MTQIPQKLAVYIDGDNIAPQFAITAWRKLSQIGTANVRNVYCRESNTPNWQDARSRYALQIKQQPACASGKNATDIAMVIDALEMAQTGLVDGFCLVSSDSDFTPLALRLRQSGFKVYGFGRTSTPQSLRDACHQFECLDPVQTDKPEVKTQALAKGIKPKAA